MRSVDKEWEISSILCHEIAHQWFGNLVTADKWGDLFLHESFATFFMTYMLIRYDDADTERGIAQFAVRCRENICICYDALCS